MLAKCKALSLARTHWPQAMHKVSFRCSVTCTSACCCIAHNKPAVPRHACLLYQPHLSLHCTCRIMRTLLPWLLY
jgi:hypothetical protein